MPASLEARGIVLLLLIAVSIGLPALGLHRALSRRQAEITGKAGEALLAVALTRYLEAAPELASESDGWLARLAGSEQRVRWAGVFDAAGEGLEFQRRTGLRREEILEQIPSDASTPALRPLMVRGRRSDRFVLLSIPQPQAGATLAAVIDLGDRPRGRTALTVTGLAGLGVAGLAAALLWLHYAIQRPVHRLHEWVSGVGQDLSQVVSAPELPEELAGLARAVRQTQRELEKWRAEAGELRYSVELEVGARTRRMSRALQAAEHQAETDALTRLANRRVLERALPELFDHAEARRRQLAVVIFDVNHFKQLNDTRGHAAGDDILRFLGQLLRATLRRATDLAVRYGGDEFVLVLPETSVTEAAAVARRLCDLFGQQMRLMIGVHPPPALAAGVAELRADRAASWQALLEMADRTMYFAKHSGLAVATAAEARRAAPA